MRVIYAREKKREIVTNVVKGGVRKKCTMDNLVHIMGN